jgi:Lipid A 3-O-deacylase (PagL)
MKRSLLFALVLATLCGVARAGETPPAAATMTQSKGFFEGGAFELELMTGAAWSLQSSHTSYAYTDTELRLGWMLYSPAGPSLLRGNLEILGAIGGGGIFQGPGSVYGAAGGILRYNFVQPAARLAPYFQIGASAFASDIARDPKQLDIGGTFEADLNSAVGLKLLLCRSWSFNTEFFFEHVSNANTQPRNVGINALGGLLGFSRSF